MEFVYVVPRSELFPSCYPHGLALFGEEIHEEEITTRLVGAGFFVEREYAERTPSLKQVIPYSLVVRAGQVMCLRRTKRGGEARLHDKLSIGVGGHVNPEDLPDDQDGGGRAGLMARATHREVVEEELAIEGPYTLRSVGLINDDSNPVGAVHVGLVQIITVEGPVSIRETDQLEGSFVAKRELHRQLAEGANFETWSSLLIPHLDRLVPESILTPSGKRSVPATGR
jgi:predicted NUDIX family phosphoesterase